MHGQIPPAPGNAALFPEADARAGSEALLAGQLGDLPARLAAGPVTPALDMAAFAAELLRFDFRTPQALDTLIPWVVAWMETGIVQIARPRYFGLFNPAPAFPAQVADRIVAAFNPQLASSTTSPLPVALEAYVAAW